MARPPIPADERRDYIYKLRLNKGERTRLDAGAAAAEQPLSEFIRGAALDKAAKLVTARKKPKR